MDIDEFRAILTSFAEEPSDVDISRGRVVARVRDEMLDAEICYSGEDRSLVVVENKQEQSARGWLVNRVARIPQLADRILSVTSVAPDVAERSPFVTPAGLLSANISNSDESDRAVSDAVDALLGSAAESIPGATSVVYLTSDAGEGKTTVINRAARLQAEKYKQKSAHSLVVPIPLSGRAFLTFDDAVIAALVNRFRFNYLYFDAFVQLVRLGVLVPAFDGYEEMLVEGSKGEAVSALGNLIQNLDSSGTIIVAARKAFFEYLSLRTQARLLDAIGDRSAAFSRLALSRWSKAQFLQYARLRKVANAEEVYEIVAARFGPDHPLLTRAVLVRRLIDVAEHKNKGELTALLGSNPHDYFYTFVDAIVRREALEKWLSRVSGDLKEPLLAHSEHHLLLSQVALEMWQSSTSSLRHDVLDVIVEIFCDSAKKRPAEVRQIKERIKQHSLLAADGGRGHAVAFDHEDFQNFYLGEGMGIALAKQSRAEIQALLSVNLLPLATVEQAIQHLLRNNADILKTLDIIAEINQTERSFSFCKENCGSFALRFAEILAADTSPVVLKGLFLPAGSLDAHVLRNVTFELCHFQPTRIAGTSLQRVEFRECEFEQLQLEDGAPLTGFRFINCRITSLIQAASEQEFYNPSMIAFSLSMAGAHVEVEEFGAPANFSPQEPDEEIKMAERLLRLFSRYTHVDDETIRLKLGRRFSPGSVDDVISRLQARRILEEVQWRGRGIRRRFKLNVPVADITSALESSGGSFDSFLSALRPS